MTRTRAECFAAAAQVAADAIAETAELYAQGGAMAVAEAAWLPGGPSLEELAAHADWLFVPVKREAAA